MDAAHWTARQHLQHGELFRHRAAETGKWMVISATSGLTQVIDPNGRRRGQLPMYQEDGLTPHEGALLASVDLAPGKTPYTRFGWLLGPTCAIATAAFVLFLSIEQRIKRPRKGEKADAA